MELMHLNIANVKNSNSLGTTFLSVLQNSKIVVKQRIKINEVEMRVAIKKLLHLFFLKKITLFENIYSIVF